MKSAFVLPLAVFVALALLFWRGLQLDPQYMPSALVDRPVPSFSLPALMDGQTLTESKLVGNVTLLNVWATWCPSCRVEHPFLNELAAQGVRLVGLNYKDDDEEARQWIEKRGNPFEAIIVDAAGLLGLDLGVTGAPETYLIDDEGVIRFRYQGPLNARVWEQHFAPRLRTIELARAG